MSVQVAKTVMQKFLNPFLFEHGFSEKKDRSSNFYYFRESYTGVERITGGFNTLVPSESPEGT